MSINMSHDRMSASLRKIILATLFFLTTAIYTVKAQVVPGSVCLPLSHWRLTSGFGYRIHPVKGILSFHSGVDIQGRSDTVRSIMDGTLISAGYDTGLGLFLIISHASGLKCCYGHLSRLFISTGDIVTAGQPIGVTGKTGLVTGEHLHFSISYQGTFISPVRFLSRLSLSMALTNNP